MATRSTIWMEKEDGNFEGIYSHWDGYPDVNGKILKKYYTTSEKIKELINLGQISILRKEIEPDKNKPHNFSNPQKDVTLAYSRDKGEPLLIYKTKSLEDIGYKYSEEYNYIFINGKWYYFKNSNYKKLIKL